MSAENSGQLVERIPTVQEESSGLVVRGNALQQCQGIADSIRRGGCELRRVQQCVYADDFLK